MQTTAELKASLNEKLNLINRLDILDDSNYKFLVILQTRLVEFGIPVETATYIASFADFDLSFAPEDDDFIGDVALTYAEFCAKVYARLKAVNFHRNLDSRTIQRFFNPIGKICP